MKTHSAIFSFLLIVAACDAPSHLSSADVVVRSVEHHEMYTHYDLEVDGEPKSADVEDRTDGGMVVVVNDASNTPVAAAFSVDDSECQYIDVPAWLEAGTDDPPDAFDEAPASTDPSDVAVVEAALYGELSEDDSFRTDNTGSPGIPTQTPALLCSAGCAAAKTVCMLAWKGRWNKIRCELKYQDCLDKCNDGTGTSIG